MNGSPPSQASAPESLRAIRIFFMAIVVGAVMFSVVVIALTIFSKPVSPFKAYETVIAVALLVIGFSCYLIARKRYEKGVGVAKDSLFSLRDKLNQYRTTLIGYLALCEAPALFGVILFFLTGNYVMYFATLAMIMVMLSKMPTLQRVAHDLDLDWHQQQELAGKQIK
jgi:hypothetical protein